MSLVSLGDLAQSFMLRRNMAQVKLEVARHSQEVTTGISHDLARHLGGNMGALDGVRLTLQRLEGYASVTSEMDLIAGTMQTALQQIDGFSDDLATPLLSAAGTQDESSISALGTAAEQKFNATIGMLNTRIGDRALFSGKATNQTALPAGKDILAELQGLVSGEVSAAAVRDLVNGWFDDPAGYAALYAGDEALEPVSLGQGETAQIKVTAISPEIVETLKGLALASLTARSATGLDHEGRASLSAMAGQSLLDSRTARANMRADLAVTENRIAAAQSQNNAEATSLKLAQARLVEVDPFEAATKLTEAQTRLETIYAITSRLSSLNLASYLR